MTEIDLGVLRDRVRAALPQLSCELGELTHSETQSRYVALMIDDPEPREKDCVYRMTVVVIDDKVNFFVHVHGKSKELTTQGAQRFSKVCTDIDEVFAIVHTCWTGGLPS